MIQIDLDDFKGIFCDKKSYPLLRTLNEQLKERDGQCLAVTNGTTSIRKQDLTTQPAQLTVTQAPATTVTTTEPTTSTSTTTSTTSEKAVPDTTTARPGSGHRLERFPSDCRYFQLFLKDSSTPVAIIKCPDSSWFDPSESTCTAQKPVRPTTWRLNLQAV